MVEAASNLILMERFVWIGLSFLQVMLVVDHSPEAVPHIAVAQADGHFPPEIPTQTVERCLSRLTSPPVQRSVDNCSETDSNNKSQNDSESQ